VTFLAIFGRELVYTWRQFLFFAVMSAIANAAVLATINQAAALPAADGTAGSLIALGIAILIYALSQRTLMLSASNLAEATVDSLRGRFVAALQSADLIDIERLDRNQLYNTIGSEMQVISDGALNLIIIGQSAILVIAVMAYLAWLSLAALLLASSFTAIAAWFHISRTQQISEQLARAFATSTALFGGFTDFVDGVKEVKLNFARSGELAAYLRQLSSEVARQRLATRELFTADFVASQVAFFLLAGVVVFVVPMLTDVDHPTVVKITASVLFLIGPISAVVGGLPVLQRVNAAADAILSVEARLTEIGRDAPSISAPPAMAFERLALDGVSFSYGSVDGEPGFHVGPINFAVNHGDVVFITGGNGSGKSTLLKLITGLYRPEDGEIRLNGQLIGPDQLSGYRNLFSAIFQDYHLFRELYGIPQVDRDRAQQYLTLMEIQDKVQIVDRSPTTLALSSGQRKRLAMVILLLEDRPVYVFDEWAADQDPAFRQKFYREIVPMLKQSGKTIIAVTHDERYFDAADFRVHLEEGQLRAEAVGSPIRSQ
jgi:putative ATP-binding cassette transporter